MPYQLITCGPLGKELNEYINASHSDLARSEFVETPEQEDLAGKNALAGFYQFDDLDLSHFEWVHAFGAGVDAYLRQPTLRSETILTRTLGYMDKRIGEFCLAYILADLKYLFHTYENQQNKIWKRKNLNVLYDKKVLVFGTGFVGQGIANALSGLAKTVDGISQSGGLKPPFKTIYPLTSPPDFDSYDIVINALPLTSKTRDFFNITFFKMLENALFINVGRGRSLVENDLISAIEKGHIRKAVLDVFQEEPLPASSPLWAHPSVVITSHQSGLTTFEDLKKSFDEVAKALKAGVRNELFVDLKKGY